MKEKELRFALVCYGGVSLAVYMHGITKEILKLIRGSRDYHTYANRQQPELKYSDVAHPRKDPTDTEAVYFELMREIGRTLDLRIVVDIIAGASAGGINGVILGRALAHDLDIDPLRDFWLKHSDVAELMPTHVKAGPWRKWYFRPFIWMFMLRMQDDLGGNKELKQKLSMFLRSRWFKPPFDGYNLTKVLFDGFSAMGDPTEVGSSLVPAGLQLDLFVTVTDFHGFATDTPIHDPPLIRDREHRQVLQLTYRHWPKGHEASEFDRASLPGLVFAARATSSFPGAFPPMQFREIDQLIAERDISWDRRVDFLYDNFRPYFLNKANPAHASFIDGSVLNNKPFAQAIEAIRGRPAYRHVDRRLLYIDPHPQSIVDREEATRAPGWISTLKGALSDIPRNEPIHDDLSWVNTHNAEVKRLQVVVDGARLHIHEIAKAIAGDAFNGPINAAQVGEFRRLANNRARLQTGFAYEGYLRLKLLAVIEDVAEVVADICGYGRETPEAMRIIAIIQRWAVLTGVSPSHEDLNRPSDDAAPPPWVKFLLRFDVRYRQRRVRFVIRAVNQLYTRLAEPELSGLKAERLDRIKAGLYDALGLLQPMAARAAATDGTGLSRTALDAVKAVVGEIARTVNADVALKADPDAVAQKFLTSITQAFNLLGDDMALEKDNTRTDALLTALVEGAGDLEPIPAFARRELIEHYIGFAVWDVLTFSITNWRDLDEFDEIRVDRLSPDDAQTLRRGDAAATLQGVKFHHFGAFFCLAYRQNDYLWGRLHAAERLIDIVLDAARLEGAGLDIDPVALKAKAFIAILDVEEKQLSECKLLFAQLREEVAALRTRTAKAS